MFKTLKFSSLFLLLVVLLTSCRVSSPTSSPLPTASSSPTPPTRLLPTATAVPSPTEQTSAIPEPTLFDQPWDDLSIYAQGLTPAYQPALDSLTGAPIYQLDIEFDENLTTLTGKEEILYTNQETVPLNEIYFRLFPNNFLDEPMKVENLSVNRIKVEPDYQLADTAMYVPLPEPLLPGERAVLRFDYSMIVPAIGESPLSIFGYGDGILTMDQFYPFVVVFDEDGWSLEDPPQWEESGYVDASFFLVRLKLPENNLVAASGVEVERENADGFQTLTFADGPARGFSFVTGAGLEMFSKTVGDTNIYSYSPPDLAGGARDALEFAANALESFAERLGSYPYTEFEIVSTPLSASGAASTGVVVVNQNYYQDQVFDVPALNDLERTVAHEFAHQWFFNLVDNDYANKLWLTEGFAQYMTNLYYLDVYGEQERQLYIQDWTARWTQVNNREIPIGLPVQQYADGEVHSIIYGRAPLFIDTLSQELGEQKFDTFLKDFLRTYQWGITSGEKFKQMGEEYCACDLTPLFDKWVYPNTNPQTSQGEAGGENDGPKVVVEPGIPFAMAQEASEFQLLRPAYFPDSFEFFGVSLTNSQEAALNYLQSEPATRLAVLVQTKVGAESQFSIVIDTNNAQTVTGNGVEAEWIYDPNGEEGLLDWTVNDIHYRLIGITDREDAIRIAESLE